MRFFLQMVALNVLLHLAVRGVWFSYWYGDGNAPQTISASVASEGVSTAYEVRGADVRTETSRAYPWNIAPRPPLWMASREVFPHPLIYAAGLVLLTLWLFCWDSLPDDTKKTEPIQNA